MRVKLTFYCWLSSLLWPGLASAQKTAVPVATFISSLGVNTHVAQGYDYTKYTPAIRYLGIQAVRDAAGNIPSLLKLHQETGVLIDIFNAGDVQALLDAGHTLAAAGALLSFEGPNEPNNFPITYDGQTGGGSESWRAVANFQIDLYAKVKSDAVLKAYPVFHVSEGGAEVDNVGMQWLTIPAGVHTTVPEGTQYADYANVHNYVSGTCREYTDNQAWQAADPVLNGCWDGLFTEYGRTWRGGFPGYTDDQLRSLPRVTTETGWDTEENAGGEGTQGRILVNTYLAQFTRGWRYTFIYELGDGEGGEGNQGLFHKDWTPKAAATYIHNLTTILADPGGAVAPAALNYSIANQPSTVHDLLMRKSDNTFELIVWSERVQGSNQVVVNLGAVQAMVKVYDTTAGTAPIQTMSAVQDVPLTLSDHAMVIEVRP